MKLVIAMFTLGSIWTFICCQRARAFSRYPRPTLNRKGCRLATLLAAANVLK